MVHSNLFSIVLFTLTCLLVSICGVETKDLGAMTECHCDQKEEVCPVDGFIGSNVIYEDDTVRVWNFTLGPGEMTSMHRHDNDYRFVVIKPSQLQVWSQSGNALYDFRAEGVMGFKLKGDFLEPIGIKFPHPVPRTHAAKNIGDSVYNEILFETKETSPHEDL
jgi:hypothetical protein